MRPGLRTHVRSHKVIAAAAGAAAVLAAAGPAAAVTVNIDQNTLIELAAPAGAVLVGNPAMVDVNLLSPRKVAVFGKAYGVTNLIITDRMGRTIYSQQVNVTAGDSGRVSVYRGSQVHNFSCSPRCERTPMPGEGSDAYQSFSNPYENYSKRATPDASGGGGGGTP